MTSLSSPVIVVDESRTVGVPAAAPSSMKRIVPWLLRSATLCPGSRRAPRWSAIGGPERMQECERRPADIGLQVVVLAERRREIAGVHAGLHREHIEGEGDGQGAVRHGHGSIVRRIEEGVDLADERVGVGCERARRTSGVQSSPTTSPSARPAAPVRARRRPSASNEVPQQV